MKISADTTKLFGEVIDSLVGRKVTVKIQQKPGAKLLPITGKIISKFSEGFPPTCEIKVGKMKDEIFLDEIRGIELM